MISSWLDKVIKRKDLGLSEAQYDKIQKFENFIEYVSMLNIQRCNKSVRSQVSLIDINQIDFLGRMESFERDVQYVFKQLGLEKKDIESNNVNRNRKPYKEYYSDELEQKVARIYRKDIQILGYKY